MDRGIKVVTDKATIIKGDGWNSITAVDFGGIDIEWTNALSGNTTITSITNGNIVKNTSNMFRGMTKLSVLDVNLDNVSTGVYMCQGDSRLKSFEIDMPNVTTLGGGFNACTSLQKLVSYVPKLNEVGTMLYKCTSLSYLDLVVNNSHSDWDVNSFGLNFFGAPCTAHRYCFSRNDDNVRLVFTADDWGDAGAYNQIDCTDDDRIETITSDTIVMLNEMGSYIADPPAGPAEHPNLPININIMLDGVFVTTTPSQLSKGKFTWSKEEHEGWTQWQDKLWFKHEPLEPEPDWIDVDVTDGYTIKDGGAYNCVGRMLIFAIQVNPPVRGVPVTQVYHLTFKNSSLDSLEVMLPLIIKGPDYTGQSIRIDYGGVWDGDVTIYDDGYGYSKIIEYTRTN